MIDEASQAEAPTTGGGTLGLDETPAELWADVDRISQMNINLDLCLNVSGGGGDSSPCACASLADAHSDVRQDTRTQCSYRSFHYGRKGQLASLLETPQSSSAMTTITRKLTFQYFVPISKDKIPIKPFPRLMKMNVPLLPPSL